MTRFQTTIRAALLSSTALGLGWTAQAHAQAAPAPAPQGGPTVAEVIVTGSAIPTTPDRLAAPVTVVDQHAIQAAGVDSSPLEIMRKTVPAFQGRGN
ncbi:MAG: hypothetical protein KGO51_07335, partial [Alphaproteobacteria bacterium]|nr:hypothetical protein [Alphaproteobacteria bacterium]